MKRGFLSEYFVGVAVKRLSAVEADVIASHQHEFNGVQGLRQILGAPVGKERYPARFIYLTDQDDEPVVDEGFLTWYDSRERARLTRGVQRHELRLYFPTNSVSQCAAEGDLLVIAKRADNTLLAIVAELGSTIERQLLWLFGFGDLSHPGFSVKSELETDQDRIGFAARAVLETIGVRVEENAPNYLDDMLQRFEGRFPHSHYFSEYARSAVADLDSREDPDAALMAWIEREEILFRTLERHLLAESLQKLRASSSSEPDAYMALTMSFQQRRKSRAANTLENHVAKVLADHGITYSRREVTEGERKPNFILPSIDCYRDVAFDAKLLTMLALKASCKDRWRQILDAAARIPDKHLLTLEPSISEKQTCEMRSKRVQLILPVALHPTYSIDQRSWLMSLAQFLELAKQRQS